MYIKQQLGSNGAGHNKPAALSAISAAQTSFSIASAAQGTKSHRDWSQASHKIPTVHKSCNLLHCKDVIHDLPRQQLSSQSQGLLLPTPSFQQSDSAPVQQHFCQRASTRVSLWFSKMLFHPTILKFCPIFPPFLPGSRSATGLEFWSYLIIWESLVDSSNISRCYILVVCHR